MKIMIAGASGGLGGILTRHFDSEENELFLTYYHSEEKVYKPQKAKATIIKCDFTKKNEVEKKGHLVYKSV